MKKSLIFMIFGAMLFCGCGNDGIGVKSKAPSCGDNDVKETVKKIIFSSDIKYKLRLSECAYYVVIGNEPVEQVMESKWCRNTNKELLLKEIEEVKQASLTEIDTIEQQDRESHCEAKFLNLSLSYSARYADDGKTLKVKITNFEYK